MDYINFIKRRILLNRKKEEENRKEYMAATDEKIIEMRKREISNHNAIDFEYCRMLTELYEELNWKAKTKGEAKRCKNLLIELYFSYAKGYFNLKESY